MSQIAEIKAASRQALHGALAADAFHQRGNAAPAAITARWHNKLARNGALEGGFDVEIIEGIDRLVFNEPELVGHPDGPITLRHNDIIDIPELGVKFRLDAEEPRDGPVNLYWTVVRAE